MSDALTDALTVGHRLVREQGDGGEWRWVEVPLTGEDFLFPQEGDRFVINIPHSRDVVYLENALQVFVNGREDVLVTFDSRVEWEHGDLRPMGPDLAVFAGVTNPDAVTGGTFEVAVQHAQPLLVIEVTSPATRNWDLDQKVILYHAARVPFYAIVDERRDEPRDVGLIGYRWTPDGYVRVPLDARGWLWMEPVRLWLAVQAGRAVCYEENGTRVPTYRQARRANRQLEARVEAIQDLVEEAIEARQQAEREAAALQEQLRAALAELERLKGTP